MSHREVYKLGTTGSEALYCFYMIGQCHPHPAAKKVCSSVKVFINITQVLQGVNSRE